MRGRRLLVLGLVLAAALAMAAWFLSPRLETPATWPTPSFDFGDPSMNWIKWSALVLLGALAAGTAWAFDAQVERQQQAHAADAERARRQQTEAERHRFAAQVVGLQWLNPLQRRDYPTEWQALWTLGLVKPNADDDVVPRNPDKYSKVGPVSGIAFNSRGKQTFVGYYEDYAWSLIEKLWERYFMSPHYFYSVAKARRPRRDVAGIRVELTLPQGLAADESAAYLRDKTISAFTIYDPKYSSSGTPPDVRVHQGGPAAGFASLDAALDYLEAHPDETVWVAAFDAPSFPKDEQINETGALLVLAHPDYQTGREPLAWIHRGSRVPVGDAGAAAAWREAFADVAKRGEIEPTALGYVIHDAGQGSAEASRRLGPLGQAMTETLPARPFLEHSFDTAALLGELRAGTAATNLVLAIAYAHHRNVPVVVAATRETFAGEARADDPAVTAVLVRPPADPTPFDPAKPWFRARGEGNAYLPWWSRRHDAEPHRMQGWSD